MRVFATFLLSILVISLSFTSSAHAQQGPGKITGTVMDSSNAVLPGARVELKQQGPAITSVVSDSQGQFTISTVAPGTYTIAVSYVGFAPYEAPVTVAAGQLVVVNPVVAVGTESESIIVTAERAHGEAESINETRTSDNILNVLPAEVIRSLPNANVADAVGRLPGVTLERDEGEAKYVQIRGTEPRLSNLTIDGVEVPSPEGGIRQVKLDVIPADLIESVQINKTLQANQDGDAIGGSVNLVTKTAGDRPQLTIYGLGGLTPIINTVPVAEGGITTGSRFGAQKRWGALISASYDYNGRGINDIEPSGVTTLGAQNGTSDLTPAYSGMSIREYKFNRNRYGIGGDTDYKLSESSDVYVRGLFSDFKDSGRRWEYVINDTSPANSQGGPPSPSFDTEVRAAHYQVASVLIGGNHVFSKYYANWGISASRSRLLNPINGGESIDTFSYVGPQSTCLYDPAATKTVYRPQWSASCYAEAYNPANFQLTNVEDAAHGQSSQLNLQGDVSVGRIYNVGSHAGRFETGFRVRNAHKFDDSYESFYLPNSGVNLTPDLFPSGIHDKNYYDRSYPLGPLTSWDKITSYVRANPGNFTLDPSSSNTYGTNPANFDLVERITAGYLMNTIDFSRFTLVTGVRIEGTQFHSASVDGSGITPICNGGPFDRNNESLASDSYIDVLPTVSLRYKLDNNSGLRFAYGRGLSRPLPSQLTTAVTQDSSTAPTTFVIGKVLKPEHANNYDVLYERYLTPLGLIQAGFFYKSLTNPIISNQALPTSGPYVGFFTNTPSNAGSAYIYGLELAFQQHFTYLPGFFSGLGVSANYSYTTSGTTKVDPLRTDNPALLRQAPTTWNLSPTYDHKRLSIRVGMAYNGPNIAIYQYRNLQVDTVVNPGAIIPNPQPGGVKGPAGDNYFYSHFQVDAQGTYYLGKGVTFIASGLNLNNEPFGFYNGSPQYLVQREYYKPTYSLGFRWEMGREK